MPLESARPSGACAKRGPGRDGGEREGGEERARHYSFFPFRFSLKNSCISSRHSSAITPATTTMRWFQLGSSISFIVERTAPVFGSGGAVYERADACVHHGADAHRARLDRHAQRRAGQPVVADLLCRRAEGANLGVCRRIDRRNRLIEAAATISSPTAMTAPMGTSSLAIALRASVSAARISSSSEMDEPGPVSTRRARQSGDLR